MVERPKPGRNEIQRWIAQAIADGAPGDRLPSIRTLMARFRTAQRTVQGALRPFVERGELVSRRGLGIVIADREEPSAASDWEADLLVLRRNSESRIAFNLLRELERRLEGSGLSLLQIGYSVETQALDVLGRLGRFRACLLQGHFQTLSIDFLAALKTHAPRIIVDGAYVTGVDVDAIGTDWREAVALAFQVLRDDGHAAIAFLTSSHSARPIAMARREFAALCRQVPAGVDLPIIQLDALPGDYRVDDIVRALEPMKSGSGRLPFTALITWGVVEGMILDVALTRLGLRVPQDLSIVMLGSTDLASEHLSRFDVVGNSDQAKIALFDHVIRARIAGSGEPARNHYLEIVHVAHGSVAPASLGE